MLKDNICSNEKINKSSFFLSVFIFCILCNIILLRAFPTALKISNQKQYLPAESLSVPYSNPLNEFLMHGEFLIKERDFYTSRMVYYSDNHLLMPLYRALKTGKHLNEMGYNEAGDNEGGSKKNLSSSDKFDYKSLYPSTWNNITEILYAFIPLELRHITTVEQEQEVAKIITKFRYILAYIQLFSMLCFFIALYKVLGAYYAWSFAVVFALNPSLFFVAGSLFKTVMMPFFNLAFVIYFYPRLMQKLNFKNFSLFVLCFTLLSAVQNIFGSLYYMLYNWAPAIATVFFMELYNIYLNKSDSWVKQLSFSILRTLALILVSTIPLFIISYIEIRQMIAIYGPETLDIISSRSDKNFMHTIYPDIYEKWQSRPMTSIYDFLVHKVYFYLRLFTSTMLTPSLWIDGLGIIKEARIKIFHIFLVFNVFLAFAYFKLRSKLYNTMVAMLFVGLCFLIYNLGLNLVSSMAGYHFHITGAFYSTHIGIILGLFTTHIIILLNKKQRQV